MRTGESKRCCAQTGFVYLVLLLGVALISIAATAALSLGATMGRRDAERELLAIGAEFHHALRNYAGMPSAGDIPATGHGPRSLDDLLRDPRAPGIRRHLRQLYADPLTGNSDWGLIMDAQGRIAGVYSLAEGKPIRQTGFEPQFAAFEQADSYRQWVFGLTRMAQPVGVGSGARQ
jgi:type II secretory pathway pseudopilin PulG